MSPNGFRDSNPGTGRRSQGRTGGEKGSQIRGRIRPGTSTPSGRAQETRRDGRAKGRFQAWTSAVETPANRALVQRSGRSRKGADGECRGQPDGDNGCRTLTGRAGVRVGAVSWVTWNHFSFPPLSFPVSRAHFGPAGRAMCGIRPNAIVPGVDAGRQVCAPGRSHGLHLPGGSGLPAARD